MLATEMTGGTDSLADALVGAGVLLLFAGVVARAFASRSTRRRRERAGPGRGPVDPGAARGASDAPTVSADALTAAPDQPLSQPLEPAAVARCAGALDPLARAIERTRRLNAAEDRVAATLATLPQEAWLVERGVRLDDRRIPFLVIGPSGVFVICASDGAWTLHDLQVLCGLGERIHHRLTGHGGEPRAVMCLAFDEMSPRAWYGGDRLRGHGWVLGIDWLLPWITDLPPDDGLGPGDVRRLDAASGPFWERRSTARLPAIPNHG